MESTPTIHLLQLKTRSATFMLALAVGKLVVKDVRKMRYFRLPAASIFIDALTCLP